MEDSCMGCNLCSQGQNENIKEKLIVEEEKCIGCGMCVGQNPDYFAFNDLGHSEVIKENVEAADKGSLLEIIEMCPTEAIRIQEEK